VNSILDLGACSFQEHISRITNAFLELLDINGSDISEWKPVQEAELTEINQRLIPLDGTRIM